MVHPFQHGRGIQGASATVAAEKACTLLQGFRHHLLGIACGLFGDHRPHVSLAAARVARHQRLAQRYESLTEGFVDRRLHENALGADAVLPRGPEGAGDAGFDRGLQLAILKYQHWRVTAQVHRQFLQAGVAGDALASDEAAGEGDHPDLTGSGERLAQLCTAGGDGDDGLRQAGFAQVVHQLAR
ncbi:hypothetical protein FQZ97_783790 [compost metagenome]